MHYKHYYSGEQLLANEANTNQRHMVTIACEALLMIMEMSALCKHNNLTQACMNKGKHTQYQYQYRDACKHPRERARTHTHTNTRMHRKTHACELKDIHTHTNTHTDIAIGLNLYIT